MAPLDEGLSRDAYDEAIVQRELVYYPSEYTAGSLRVCHCGCAIYYLLVVTGPQSGRIWVDDRASDQGIYPALEAGTGRPLSFSDWYGDWLKTSLSSLDTELL
jgi:hypothetical protein